MHVSETFHFPLQHESEPSQLGIEISYLKLPVVAVPWRSNHAPNALLLERVLGAQGLIVRPEGGGRLQTPRATWKRSMSFSSISESRISALTYFSEKPDT